MSDNLQDNSMKLLMDAVNRIHMQTTDLQRAVTENAKETSAQFTRLREHTHKIANDQHATQALLGFIRTDIESVKAQLEKEITLIHSRISDHSKQSNSQISEAKKELKEIEAKLQEEIKKVEVAAKEDAKNASQAVKADLVVIETAIKEELKGLAVKVSSLNDSSITTSTKTDSMWTFSNKIVTAIAIAICGAALVIVGVVK